MTKKPKKGRRPKKRARRDATGETAWRRFERAVALIEHTFAPRAAVKSPDKVRDLISGRLREVDATVRMRIGSIDALVTIECRKRIHRQDVTWIEQLNTKREQIGAHATIAVSERGFSDSAIDTARRYGIELRTLEDVSNVDEVRKWFEGIRVEALLTHYQLVSATIRDAAGGDLKDQIHPDVINEFRLNPVDSDKILVNVDGLPLRLRSYLEAADTSDLVPGGEPCSQSCNTGVRP